MPLKPNKKFLIRFAITLVLCAILYFQLKHSNGLREMISHLNSIEWKYIFLSGLVFFISLMFSTIQWYMLLRIQKIRIPVHKVFSFYMIGQFFSNFLPTNWGGDIVRIYDISKYNDEWEKGTASIVFDRVIGFFMLFVVGFIYAIVYYRNYFPLKYLIIAFAVVVLFIVLYAVFDLNILVNLLKKNKTHTGWMGKLINFTIKFISSLEKYQKEKKKLYPVLFIAFITQYLRILMNYFIVLSLHYPIPYNSLFIIIPIVGFATALPLSINGIGIREIIGTFISTTLINTHDDSMIIIFTIGYIIILAVSAIGGVYFLLDRIRDRRRLSKARAQ